MSNDRDSVEQTSYDWTELMLSSRCFRRESDICQYSPSFSLQSHQHGVAGGGEGEGVEGPLDKDDGVVVS